MCAVEHRYTADDDADDGWANFDSHNIAFWDTEQEQYVAYMRGWINPGFRSIRRSVSDDFISWSEPTFINLGSTKLEHLYTNAATQYYRARHIYMMFPMRFTPDRQFDTDWLHDGLSEAVFMTSRDGQLWSRRFMEAYIPPGPDQENWNERNMIVASGLRDSGAGSSASVICCSTDWAPTIPDVNSTAHHTQRPLIAFSSQP